MSCVHVRSFRGSSVRSVQHQFKYSTIVLFKSFSTYFHWPNSLSLSRDDFNDGGNQTDHSRAKECGYVSYILERHAEESLRLLLYVPSLNRFGNPVEKFLQTKVFNAAPRSQLAQKAAEDISCWYLAVMDKDLIEWHGPRPLHEAARDCETMMSADRVEKSLICNL